MKLHLTKSPVLLLLIIMFTFIPLNAQGVTANSDSKGSIEIISSPDKAMVHIDGKKLGLTPYTAKDLTLGDHALLIHKQGFQDHEQHFTIVSGTNSSIGVALDKLTEIKITSKPKGAAVYLSGKLIGTTPFQDQVPTGKHSLQLKLLGYGDLEQEVVIVEDYSKKFTLAKLFEINFTSDPVGAEIFLDGKYIGDTPFVGSYSAGKHAIRLSLESYEMYDKQIKLKKNLSFDAELKKVGQGSGFFKKTIILAAIAGGGYYYYINYIDVPSDAGFPTPPNIDVPSDAGFPTPPSRP